MKLYGIKKIKYRQKMAVVSMLARYIKKGTRIINYVGKIITKKQTEESEKFDND